jgi:hypothetical protein
MMYLEFWILDFGFWISTHPDDGYQAPEARQILAWGESPRILIGK